MTRRVAVLRAAVAALAWLAATPALALKVGDALPALSAPARDGTPLTLAQFRGKILYVDFWASWCAPCQEEMPALDMLYRRYRERGLVVLGVNVDTDRRLAQRMLDKFAPSFPIAFDPQGEWPEAFALPAMPTGYLVDAKGVVRFIKSGYRPAELPQLEAAIQAVLGSNDDPAKSP